MALMTTFNLTGGALYAMRVSEYDQIHELEAEKAYKHQIPEKWHPYRFDV